MIKSKKKPKITENFDNKTVGTGFVIQWENELKKCQQKIKNHIHTSEQKRQ